MTTMAVTTEDIWQAFSTPLRRFIRRRVGDDESAEDILQDVFLKIPLHIDGLRQREKLQSWVYQVACLELFPSLRRKLCMKPLWMRSHHEWATAGEKHPLAVGDKKICKRKKPL